MTEPSRVDHDQLDVSRLRQVATATLTQLSGCVLGQESAAESLLATYMAGGHALLEGVPGLGKTLLARCFSACLGVPFARVQFTPDLMPADVIGTNIYQGDSGRFKLLRGPIFTHVLMADEINRTPPKTQSALLEAMQERQVTIDGETHPLPPEFFVIATQNPLEFEGVYPLPEAQLDRFQMRIDLQLPSAEAEVEIYRRAVAGDLPGWGPDSGYPEPVMTASDAAGLRQASRATHVSADLLDYLYRLAAAARSSPYVELGISPRGALALLEVSRAGALLAERDFVAPDDFKRFLAPCWAHRMILTAESELEGQTAAKVLETVAATVEVPR